MNLVTLHELMSKVSPGHKLKLTFLRGQGDRQKIDNAMRSRLSIFCGAKDIEMSFSDKEYQTLMSVLENGHWENDKNRTISIAIMGEFNCRWFEKQFGPILESVAVIP
jgi:hypothetical protein